MSKASFIKSVSEKLNQPTSIAVMASVGIHALLGVSLPYVMPVFSREEPPLRQTVQLLELTPADLSRLPDLSVPSIPPSLYYQTPLSSQSLLPSQTPQVPLNLDGTISLYPRKSTSTSSSQSSSSTKRTNRTPNSVTPNSSQRQRLTNKELRELLGRGVTAAPTRNILEQLEQLESADPKNEPSDSSNTSMDSLANRRLNQDQESLTLAQRGIAPPREPFKPKKHDIVAHNPQANHQSPTNENSEAQRPQPSQRNTHDLARNSKPDSTNTNNQEAQPNNPTGRDGNVPTIPMRLAGTYPKEACSEKLSGTAVFRVLVGADSKIANIQLLQSAGNSAFDQQARQDINARSFPNSTAQPKSYRVSVAFEYDKKICPSSSAPPDSSQPQNAPEPQNSPKPETTPEARQTPTPQNSPEPETTPEAEETPKPQNSPNAQETVENE